MFKKYTKQLFFYSLLFSFGAAYSAADGSVDKYGSSSFWGKQPQGKLDKGDFFEEHERMHAEYRKKEEDKKQKEQEGKKEEDKKELPKPKRIIPDEIFDQLLWRYKTDLPSEEDAASIVTRLMKDHPDLKFTIPCIKDPNYCEGEYPSRLLFVGPSGCGKTTAAKAVATYCKVNCVFLKGSQIGNTYQNSGAVLINNLFNGLIERPNYPCIVIIDEFISVSQYTEDDKDRQQRQTAMALWQALDDCERKRHICVIGTDNGDPDKLPLPIKTRFAYNIFEFHHMNQSDIVTFMKKRLGYSLESGAENPCSDRALNQLAQSVKSFSWREIDILLSKSRMLAAHELHENKYKSLESKLIVKEEHLRKIFDTHRDLTWLEKVWIDRGKHLRNLVSARAISLYMTLGGIGLQASDSQYRKYGFALAALGACMNHYWPRDEKDASDLPLFSAVGHLFAQHENRRQWEISHTFNVQNSEEAKIAREEDAEKSDRHLELAESAEARGIRQEEKSDEHFKWEQANREQDRELRLREGIQHSEITYYTTPKNPILDKIVRDHTDYLKQELDQMKLSDPDKNK